MYNVALVYTDKAGGYEGVVTWTSFKSKKDFDEWFTEKLQETHRVVEKGVSEERCKELTRRTPKACRISAALQEATGEDGEINQGILAMRLATINFQG